MSSHRNPLTTEGIDGWIPKIRTVRVGDAVRLSTRAATIKLRFVS